MDSKDEDYRSIPTRPTRAKRKLLGSLLGMNAIAAPSTLSHQQYSNPIRGSASTSSDKVTPFSRPSTPPVARHSEISSLHLLQRPRPMPFSMAVAIAVSQIITEIDGDGDFHTSGQFRSTHGRLVLVRADGQIVICDTHILQSTHTQAHMTSITKSYIIYIMCLFVCVCVGVCIYRWSGSRGSTSFWFLLHADFLSWSSLHVFGCLSIYIYIIYN